MFVCVIDVFIDLLYIFSPSVRHEFEIVVILFLVCFCWFLFMLIFFCNHFDAKPDYRLVFSNFSRKNKWTQDKWMWADKTNIFIWGIENESKRTKWEGKSKNWVVFGYTDGHKRSGDVRCVCVSVQTVSVIKESKMANQQTTSTLSHSISFVYRFLSMYVNRKSIMWDLPSRLLP